MNVYTKYMSKYHSLKTYKIKIVRLWKHLLDEL